MEGHDHAKPNAVLNCSFAVMGSDDGSIHDLAEGIFSGAKFFLAK